MKTSELDQQFNQKMIELEDVYQAFEWLKGLLLSGEVEMVTVLNWWKEKVRRGEMTDTNMEINMKFTNGKQLANVLRGIIAAADAQSLELHSSIAYRSSLETLIGILESTSDEYPLEGEKG